MQSDTWSRCSSFCIRWYMDLQWLFSVSWLIILVSRHMGISVCSLIGSTGLGEAAIVSRKQWWEGLWACASSLFPHGSQERIVYQLLLYLFLVLCVCRLFTYWMLCNKIKKYLFCDVYINHFYNKSKVKFHPGSGNSFVTQLYYCEQCFWSPCGSCGL